MPMHRWLVITLAVGLALGALPTGADGADAPPKAPPGATPVELPTMPPDACDKQFAEFDADRNGKLSYAEYADGRFGQLRFASAPTEREVKGFLAGYTAVARKADVNRDGWLSRAEHRAVCQQAVSP